MQTGSSDKKTIVGGNGTNCNWSVTFVHKQKAGPKLVVPRQKTKAILQRACGKIGDSGRMKTELSIGQSYWRLRIYDDLVTHL